MKKVLILFVILAMIVSIFSGCDLLMNLLNGDEEPDDGGNGGNPITVDLLPGNLMFITESDRDETYPGSGYSESTVEIEFETPLDFGADSYTLQISTDNSNWSNYDEYGSPYVTQDEYSSGFSPSPPSTPCWFRLLISGGDYDGEVSDAMEVLSLSSLNTEFASWNLDYNATAVIMPHVGFGITASCTVRTVLGPVTGIPVTEENLSYQWFRVNPNDYEDIEEITGATTATYITTTADINHLMMVRMTGDGTEIGGYLQVLCDGVVY